MLARQFMSLKTSGGFVEAGVHICENNDTEEMAIMRNKRQQGTTRNENKRNNSKAHYSEKTTKTGKAPCNYIPGTKFSNSINWNRSSHLLVRVESNRFVAVRVLSLSFVVKVIPAHATKINKINIQQYSACCLLF